MIVQRLGTSMLLITQPDHAALAARLMEHWRADGFPDAARRQSILHAIQQHDNGWQELDSAPILDPEGLVLDFIAAPDGSKRGVWPRGVHRLASTPHAAALVAQHGLHIYRRHRKDLPWASFFTELTRLRDEYVHRARVSIEELLRDYFFLRIGDLVSLTFCNGWAEPQTDDSGSGYEMQLEGTRLTISPDPFEGSGVPLEITARALPTRIFVSAEEATSAYAHAPSVILKGMAVGANPT
jgi:uncharacterized protein DUF3891